MFNKLSFELLERIAACLDDSVDLLTLRLVCRRLWSATDNLFASTWFRIVTVDFTPRSLLRLENIAHHEFLRESVRLIRVGSCKRPPAITPLGLHPPDYTTKAYGEGNSWSRTESGSLDLDAPFIRDIQDLLLRFTRCTEISVTDVLGAPNGLDKTLGLSAVDALILMCSVLAHQEVTHIENFTIVFRRRLIYPRLDPLLRTIINSPSFQASWSSIRYLRICWSIEEEIVDLTLDLIVRATSLRSLLLHSGLISSPDPFLHRLAQSPSVPALTYIACTTLMGVTPNTLAGVILRSKDSLISIRLGIVNIVPGDWNVFFGLLEREEFPFLETIAVTRPHKAFFCPLRMRQCGGQFEFLLNSYQNKTRVKGVRYTGPRPGMKLALKALANQSSYSLKGEPQSPGYPDMEHFDDRVGVVART